MAKTKAPKEPAPAAVAPKGPTRLEQACIDLLSFSDMKRHERKSKPLQARTEPIRKLLGDMAPARL